jgi:signal transduction histidine kinase
METCFAPAERATAERLRQDMEAVRTDPLIARLLQTAGGLAAVLNDKRQILVVNEALLAALDIPDPAAALGLRLGEALQCRYAQEPPHGCGTSVFCQSCGAATAMVACLGQHQPVERTCALAHWRNGRIEERLFSVRACPLGEDPRRLILIFLQDITHQHRLAALERVFFQEVGGIVHNLAGLAQRLAPPATAPLEPLQAVQDLVRRLSGEVALQRRMAGLAPAPRGAVRESVSLDRVVRELAALAACHPAGRGRSLALPAACPEVRLRTDFGLLLKVLNQMLINALEAAAEGEAVRCRIEVLPEAVTWRFWNRRPIPRYLARRMFQRHVTTKPEPGRGWGGHTMKLVGEKLLGGRVEFESSSEAGTEFRFTLPT